MNYTFSKVENVRKYELILSKNPINQGKCKKIFVKFKN